MIISMYCYKCGHEISDGDKFCQNCGAKTVRPKRFNAVKKAKKQSSTPPKQEKSMLNNDVQAEKKENTKASVRYVYIDKKTGKITKNPAAKSSRESLAQWMTILFIVFAVIIVMIAGAMFISGYMVKNVFSGNVEINSDMNDEFSNVDDTVSESISSNGESSEASSIPPDLLAENIQSKIKGTWNTDIPYKSMTIPATFVFDGNGKCSCNLKALFISKKFEGNYSVSDGGSCSITLDGLEDYVGGNNTMVGNVEFNSDDQMTFTVENTVWKLSRVQ